MTTDKAEKVAIYSRKSKFTGKGESIDNQIEMCRNYISLKYGAEVAESVIVYEDEGFSGGNLDRPRFKLMMEDVRKGKVTAVVCYRLDRISRNIGDFAKLIEDFEKTNVVFISVKEQFDLSSPMGRAMMYISSVFSQLERETIAERIRDNLHELAKTGRWLGGITPTGYMSESEESITVDGKKKKSHKLQIVPDEAEMIKTIFRVFLEKASLTETDAYLLQNAFKSKNDKMFSRFSIKGILSNPVYMIADEQAYKYFEDKEAEIFAEKQDFTGEYGIMAYNRTLQKKGQMHKIRPYSEWIVAIGKHEGIIKSEDWIKVQSILDVNRSKSYRKPRSNVALLSGVLICGLCGDYMRPKLSDRKNKNGEQVYDYMCNLKERSKKSECQIKNLNGIEIDKAVCEEIKKLGSDSSEFIKRLKKVKNSLFENGEKNINSISRLEKELDENEAKIEKRISFLLDVSDEVIKKRITEEISTLNTKSEDLKSKIVEVKQILEPHPLSTIEFDLIEDILISFTKTIDTMSVEQKRDAIRTFIKKVVWDGENVHIYLFGAGEVEALPEPYNASDNDHTFSLHEFPLGEHSK